MFDALYSISSSFCKRVVDDVLILSYSLPTRLVILDEDVDDKSEVFLNDDKEKDNAIGVV